MPSDNERAKFGLVHVIEASPGYNRIVINVLPSFLLSTDLAREVARDLEKAIQFVEERTWDTATSRVTNS